MVNEGRRPNRITESIEVPELRGNLTTELDGNNILQKYSSYSKTLRIIALCLRFQPKNVHQGQLCSREIEEAEIKVMKLTQASCFSHELRELSDKRPLKRSNINALNPFIDPNDLIRVSGRLKGSKLTFAQKHPILLPSCHFITDLIIKETHERRYHSGIQTTLYNIRQKFCYLMNGIRCARSYDRVYGAFASMPTRSITRWITYQRQEYPKLFRLHTPESTSAGRSISKKKNIEIEIVSRYMSACSSAWQ